MVISSQLTADMFKAGGMSILIASKPAAPLSTVQHHGEEVQCLWNRPEPSSAASAVAAK